MCLYYKGRKLRSLSIKQGLEIVGENIQVFSLYTFCFRKLKSLHDKKTVVIWFNP